MFFRVQINIYKNKKRLEKIKIVYIKSVDNVFYSEIITFTYCEFKITIYKLYKMGSYVVLLPIAVRTDG